MKHSRLAFTFSSSLFLATVLLGTSAQAASPKYKDVCPSGCTYSSVQTAIDSITDSGPDNVYTIFLDSGVLFTDTSITTNGKSYINFVGRDQHHPQGAHHRRQDRRPLPGRRGLLRSQHVLFRSEDGSGQPHPDSGRGDHGDNLRAL